MVNKLDFSWILDAFRGLSRPVWILSLVTLINRAGMMVIPFLSVYMTNELSFSLEDTAYIMGAFGAGSLVGTYLGGQISDYLGYHKVMYGSLLLNGLSFLGLSLVSSFWGFLIGIFITMIFADAFRPASMASISIYSKEENQTRSLSLIRLAFNLGFTVGPAVGGYLAFYYGYEYIFYVDGWTCIFAGALVFFMLQPKNHLEIEKEESSELKEVSPYKNIPYLWFCLFVAILALIFLQVFTTVPTFWKNILLLNEKQIGNILAMNGLLLAIIELPVVYWLEGKIRPLIIVLIGTILISVGFLGMALFSGFWWTILIMILITFGELAALPFASSLALKFAPAESKGAYMSVYGVAWSAAMLVGPFLGLNLADKIGFRSVYFLFAILGLLSAVGFYIIRKHDEQ